MAHPLNLFSSRFSEMSHPITPKNPLLLSIGRRILMSLKPHSAGWYDRLSTLQSGYYYPWNSNLPSLNGEDVFLSLLNGIISPTKHILEVGCGHGELALQLAASCQTIVAYDRVPAYIRLAQASADQQTISNVTFICADSSIAANGQAHIPPGQHVFDDIYSRRGPLHW